MAFERGNEYWKFNNSILKDILLKYQRTINKIKVIEIFKNRIIDRESTDIRLLWDILKIYTKDRDKSINYCKRKSKLSEETTSKLESQFELFTTFKDEKRQIIYNNKSNN